MFERIRENVAGKILLVLVDPKEYPIYALFKLYLVSKCKMVKEGGNRTLDL